MPIFTFGAVMLIGMGTGLAGQAALDSSKNVIQTCNSIEKAKEIQNNVETEYTKLIKDSNIIETNLNNYLTTLGSQKQTFKAMTSASKKFSDIDRNAKILGLSIFLFVIVLSLLLKYFNVIPNIWNYITKN